MKVGLNLYSIRNLIQTEEAFLDTANKLRDMGYSYLQFSGAPFDADKIARVSKQSGLPVYLTHVAIERILDDTDKLMEEHARFGCHYIGLGNLPVELMGDWKALDEMLEKLDKAGERMEKNGFKLCYHHHHFEFMKTDEGDTVYERILKKAPHVYFTADTYWLQSGGVSVIDCLEKSRGRVPCAHLKDYAIVRKANEEWFESKFAPVGDGVMDFAQIVAKCKDIGTEYFFVEQDDAVEYPDPLAQVERSISYIKKNF